jgi:hypothetical protein
VWDTFLWENLHIEPKPNCMLNVAHLADCDVNIRAMSTTHLFIIIKLLNALVKAGLTYTCVFVEPISTRSMLTRMGCTFVYF